MCEHTDSGSHTKVVNLGARGNRINIIIKKIPLRHFILLGRSLVLHLHKFWTTQWIFYLVKNTPSKYIIIMNNLPAISKAFLRAWLGTATSVPHWSQWTWHHLETLVCPQHDQNPPDTVLCLELLVHWTACHRWKIWKYSQNEVQAVLHTSIHSSTDLMSLITKLSGPMFVWTIPHWCRADTADSTSQL